MSDRAAQDHERAGDTALQAGDYPASPIEHRDQDNTPTAPGDAPVPWDELVQPERQAPGEPQRTELEQDESDDASKRERAIELDDDEPGAQREGPDG